MTSSNRIVRAQELPDGGYALATVGMRRVRIERWLPDDPYPQAEVVDLRTLYPMDKECVLDSVKKTGKALIIHEDVKTGGVGGEIAAIIAEEAFDWLDAPIRRLGAPDVPAVPFSRPLQDFFMPNVEKIEQAIRKLAAY